MFQTHAEHPVFLSAIFHIINETNGALTAINGDAAHDVIRVVPIADGLQRDAVNNLEIFHLESVNGVETVHHFVVGLGHRVALREVDAFKEHLRDVHSRCLFLRREQGVAAAQCQSAFFAHNGARAELQRKVEVFHHRTDNGNLLEILLAEIGTRWHTPLKCPGRRPPSMTVSMGG